jgi:uncharacterized protein with HEPN domain
MPQRDVRLYLHDIALTARLLAEFTDGKAWSDYQAGALLRSGVERQFEIIGEALSQACRVDPGLADRISHCHQIIAFRNRLIHGDASIADEVVRDVREAYLPSLTMDAESLLAGATRQV